MSADIITALLHDMATAGIVPSKPSVIQFDTKDFIRFHCVGDKSGSKNGFFKGFSDGRPAGIFGSWKAEAQHRWVHGELSTITDADIERIKELQHERENEQAQQYERASKIATARFNELPEATGTPYSERKMIVPYNAKQHGTALVVAVQDFDGKIWTVQTIFCSERKQLMKNGKKKGNFIYIGGNPKGRLLICEGFATACSLRQMDDNSEVIAAIDAYNMYSVAQAARNRFPDREIILAGDNDDVGVECAERAANAIGGLILIPPEPETDWNDFAVANIESLGVA